MLIEEPKLVIYTNGFTINMYETDTPGFSGGPIIKDGLVKGILIRTNNCISINYIIEKLKEKNISYQAE